MNLDQLIEALQDLKQSGREVGKAKVYFEQGPQINSVSIHGKTLYSIQLSS